MKKLILAGVAAFALASSSASAADMPVKAAPVAAPAPVFTWTGCYIGVEGGGAWGRSQHIGAADDAAISGFPISDSFNLHGGLVGGTSGAIFRSAKSSSGRRATARG